MGDNRARDQTEGSSRVGVRRGGTEEVMGSNCSVLRSENWGRARMTMF